MTRKLASASILSVVLVACWGCDALLNIILPPEPCGGLLGLACGEGRFCRYEIGQQCGAADQTGVCVPPPDVCTLVYMPVCGCDDKTYANECEAWAHGVSAAKEGECEGDPGEFCGGIAGVPCGEGEYCLFDPGVCGEGDQSGTCAEIPDVCTEEFAPVCGCDGRTYENSCAAARAGLSIEHEGECADGGRACGGVLDVACPEGEYCHFEAGVCGEDEESGTCEAIPENCTEEFAPVCGCDGETYDNDCFAAAAGVSIDHDGACGGPG